MKYGYVSSVKNDLISEIVFAKKYFDFIEITLDLKLSKYSAGYISRAQKILGDFLVLGHIYWKIDLSKDNISTELKRINQTLVIFKKLGAKKITIHPSANFSQNEEKTKTNNLKSLKEISDYCRKNKLQLMIENITKPPFNKTDGIKQLIEKIPGSLLTLDLGHANRISRTELKKFFKIFKNKVGHIHLHDNVGDSDHLFFNDKDKLKKLIKQISNTGYNGTISLETFDKIKNKKTLSLKIPQRRRNLKEHLFIAKIKII